MYIFFFILKWQINIIKNIKKDSKKKHVKDIKIFIIRRYYYLKDKN